MLRGSEKERKEGRARERETGREEGKEVELSVYFLTSLNSSTGRTTKSLLEHRKLSESKTSCLCPLTLRLTMEEIVLTRKWTMGLELENQTNNSNKKAVPFFLDSTNK